MEQIDPEKLTNPDGPRNLGKRRNSDASPKSWSILSEGETSEPPPLRQSGEHALESQTLHQRIWSVTGLSLEPFKHVDLHYSEVEPFMKEYAQSYGWETTVERVHEIAQATNHENCSTLIFVIGLQKDKSAVKGLLGIIADKQLNSIYIRDEAAWAVYCIHGRSAVGEAAADLVDILCDDKELPECTAYAICTALKVLDNRSVKDKLELISSDEQSSATTRSKVQELLQHWKKWEN